MLVEPFPKSEPPRGVYWVLGGVTVVAVATLVVLWVFVEPVKDTLPFELAKTAMAVLSVAVAGGVVTFATQTFQGHREDQANSARDAATEQHVKELRDKDERDRRDSVLQAWFEETLATYNSVKETRRHLQAETNDGEIGRTPYADRLGRLIVDQLKFESLKKRSSGLVIPGVEVASLTTMYTRVEEFLNEVIDEYQGVPMRNMTAVATADLDKLNSLLSSTKFQSNVSEPIDTVLRTLQDALLEPVDYTTVRDEVSPGAESGHGA